MTHSKSKVIQALNALDDACDRCRYEYVATPKIAKTIIALKHQDPDALPLLRQLWRSLLLPSGDRRWNKARQLLTEIKQHFKEIG